MSEQVCMWDSRNHSTLKLEFYKKRYTVNDHSDRIFEESSFQEGYIEGGSLYESMYSIHRLT